MPSTDQKVNSNRYKIIPRVLVFVMRNDEVLLIKLLPRNGKATSWTGRYNGPGGHVERGEDALHAARRELFEETGLTADLSLCGFIIVDTAVDTGIGLFVFRGQHPKGELASSAEGIPEWVPFEKMAEYPVVEDVSIFLQKMALMKWGEAPFIGRSFYDDNDHLQVIIQ